MDLITPGLGLIFWMTLIFVLLVVLLKKFAWTPLLNAVSTREQSIADALSQAEKARAEMAALTAQNEEVLKEAKAERNNILREANKVKDQIIAEAKEQTQINASKIMADAREDIEMQKRAVMADMKNAAAELSLNIAEKVLSRELSDKTTQEKFINEMAEKATLN